MKKFEEKTIQSEVKYKGRIISLQIDEVELPNGKTSNREIVKHPGAVAVIAVTKDMKIILVEQYRKALERSIIEIPAGKIEIDEVPEITALRELEEETGYTTDKLQYIQSFATSPGFADEIIHLYFAENIEKLEQPVGLDEDEFVELLHVSLSEMEEMVKKQQIYDAKTAFAYIWLKDYFKEA
ncbi:NUDIX hydrolase [Psychrobacillus psychrodurans]|uniref:NUDIX hydrolase n=1 Tax=Psychrobacillus TaxID=1221880 RepID=UPI0008E0315B|nr:NUDIX hydrolase [Psychrobacillus psychrodurans]MCK1998017.1 NUDIX hydrolase [Psychrobacillus psychrodurans]MCZ8540155.1 NUDIX hydrolase [Psychrobacillus psychrodurans]SFM49001.1 ADP-ribose pyrophosphatase [Psychrobacillus psychrodurans]